MASGFPGSIDNFTDPLTTSALNSPSHAGQHQDLNDAVEKIETYMGLVKVIPTSGTNCTISATGTITVTNGVTSFSINGAFSSSYDNYRISISNLESSSPGGGYYLTLGTAVSGSAYYMGGFYVNVVSGAMTNINRNNLDKWIIGSGNTGQKYATTIDVCAPNLPTITQLPTANIYSEQGFIGVGAGLQYSTTQHTSFTISSAGATFSTGTIRVYGYRN